MSVGKPESAKSSRSFTRAEIKNVQEKVKTWRTSLSARELELAIALGVFTKVEKMGDSRRGDPDNFGCTKIDSRRIGCPGSDGTDDIQTCPGGATVQAVEDGQGGFNWLCVDDDSR